MGFTPTDRKDESFKKASASGAVLQTSDVGYLRQVILKATQVILLSTDYGAINLSVQQLLRVFSDITGIRAEDSVDADIALPSGIAVSPVKAGRCLMEIERTRIFLRGIYEALQDLTAKNPSGKINILYAGCGPYATLITPLTSLFTPEQISITLLDINKISLDAARKLYTALRLMPYVKAFVYADAATYQLNDNGHTDIVISETMLNALRKEPQLAIMDNILPQLKGDAIFIPQEIAVDAVLLNWQEELQSFSIADYRPERVIIGNVYKAGRDFSLPRPLTLDLPPPNTHRRLTLLTDIQVYRNEKLTAYSCSLTLPYHVVNLDVQQWPEAVRFDYKMGENPRFRHSLIY